MFVLFTTINQYTLYMQSCTYVLQRVTCMCIDNVVHWHLCINVLPLLFYSNGDVSATKERVAQLGRGCDDA